MRDFLFSKSQYIFPQIAQMTPQIFAEVSSGSFSAYLKLRVLKASIALGNKSAFICAINLRHLRENVLLQQVLKPFRIIIRTAHFVEEDLTFFIKNNRHRNPLGYK